MQTMQHSTFQKPPCPVQALQLPRTAGLRQFRRAVAKAAKKTNSPQARRAVLAAAAAQEMLDFDTKVFQKERVDFAGRPEYIYRYPMPRNKSEYASTLTSNMQCQAQPQVCAVYTCL